eukprot:CAMPEP_0172171426 /NCGR_PEP_ID=MMETSP1050-20130122/11887_1 /TAXON_ID=233186 /ORGANISM="Cryptomonas curvata, Strain CCAP979/52" /LENGTH=388 /DNA_ID=CAMNT_0012842859 /DNA_START=112 /DNA_END=1275 /DNA_ORIENTATION=+
MFGWGADGIRSLEIENQQLKARIRALEGSLEPRNVVSIHTAPCVIFGISPNFTINVWNQEAARITGYSSDEAVGQGLSFLLPEDNLGHFRGILESSISLQSPSNAAREAEISILGKDGKRIVLLNYATRRDSGGSVIDTIFVGQDITKRKHSEEEKIRLATELQTFIDVANAAIFGIDQAGRINEWNHQSAEITGLSKEEVMGRDFLQVLIEPEFRASVEQVLQNALQGKGTANFEFPFFTKDRRRVDVLLNATTRRDADGAVIGAIGVGQDITERKQVEVEKARVAQELQTFIDTANAPIFGIDDAGKVNEWNNKAVEITNFSREEVLGKDLVEVYITEEFRASVKEVLDNALQGKETANFEFPLFTKDKHRVEVLLNATTRRDVTG